VVEVVIVGMLALALGLVVGWLMANRRASALASDLAVAQARAADADLIRQTRDAVERERNDALQELRGLRERTDERERTQALLAQDLADLRVRLATAEQARADAASALAEHQARAQERDQAHALAMRQLTEAREQLNAQFGDTAAKALATASEEFLKRAEAKLNEAGHQSGHKLSQLLQPVETTLKRYEENLGRIEKEREGSYRELSQAVAQLAQGNAHVVRETQRLTNVMRSSPKARGRWGEEQLRTILESAGLSENVDFALQTTVNDGERQLRPDCVVNLPGDRCIVIDVKCPLVAFEQAFDEEDELRRADLLKQHADSLKSYARDLGGKGYWRQFDRSPDFVIMFVPGEHFLSAAAERAPDLIEGAFRNGVIVASTINMLALAKIMAGMWRQEVVREQAKEIAEAGKELYRRLATLSGHVSKLGRNLGIAAGAYNDMVGSLESQVYTQAERFEKLGVETSAKKVESAPLIETVTRPLSKLASPPESLAAE
jgi:DNA recombination protein RmuC